MRANKNSGHAGWKPKNWPDFLCVQWSLFYIGGSTGLFLVSSMQLPRNERSYSEKWRCICFGNMKSNKITIKLMFSSEIPTTTTTLVEDVNHEVWQAFNGRCPLPLDSHECQCGRIVIESNTWLLAVETVQLFNWFLHPGFHSAQSSVSQMRENIREGLPPQKKWPENIVPSAKRQLIYAITTDPRRL